MTNPLENSTILYLAGSLFTALQIFQTWQNHRIQKTVSEAKQVAEEGKKVSESNGANLKTVIEKTNGMQEALLKQAKQQGRDEQKAETERENGKKHDQPNT